MYDKINSEKDHDMVILSCLFNEPKDDDDGGKALGQAILSMG